jgi:hypothetical protein
MYSLDCHTFFDKLRRFAMTGNYFFFTNMNSQKSKMTHPVMDISATLKTAKYCTLIKSVTEPKNVRSRAFKSHPMIIMKYPVFSISEILFHDFQRKTPIPRRISGITKEIPGRGVPKATPVFLTCVILRIFPITEKSGSAILTQYFESISVRITKKRRMIFFIF